MNPSKSTSRRRLLADRRWPLRIIVQPIGPTIGLQVPTVNSGVERRPPISSLC